MRDLLYGASGTALQVLHQHRMWLLRQVHGMVSAPQPEPIHIIDIAEQTFMSIKMNHTTRMSDLVVAQQRLHREGYTHVLEDLYGRMNPDYLINRGPISGHFVMTMQPKRQRRSREPCMIKVTVMVKPIDGMTTNYTMDVASGVFVFEIFNSIPIMPVIHYENILDSEGNKWRADDRIWRPVTFAEYDFHKDLRGSGILVDAGTGDASLDWLGRHLVQMMEGFNNTWIPARHLTQLVVDDTDHFLQHWLVGALHGTLRGVVALQNHWTLLEFSVVGDTLVVFHWDGLLQANREHILQFTERVKKVLALRTYILEYGSLISQEEPNTCGAVAILHLGLRLNLWTLEDMPGELKMHAMILRIEANNVLYAMGWGEDDEDTLILKVREVLHAHGVPEGKSEERVLAALKRIGQDKIQKAMQVKNAWGALKALGSAPKCNFLWVKPDELDVQIKKRAQAKFRVSTSEKKRQGSSSTSATPSIDPTFLQLIPDTFVTEDERQVSQILMEQVATDKAGVAFGTVADVIPFLKEDRSLSMDALAILTTSPVSPDVQGLLPVSNLRFPALYGPTMEAILIEGSLVQLGDVSVIRKQAPTLAAAKTLDTKTYKMTVWRDEWPGPWDKFITSPVKKVIEQTPRLLLCKGDRCGQGCPRFHAPVDYDIDQVVVDLWSRGWHSNRGKRTPPEDSDQFSVLMRIPAICAEGLQYRSGQDGIYYEPRQDDGKSPAPDFTVIWCHGSDKGEALHRLKVTDRAVALVRYGQKYGIRTMLKDAEAVHRELHPDQPYENVAVHSVYEVRPLPHGMQTAGIRDLLHQWGWKAKPLQPFRADQHGHGWLIGSDMPPPANVFQTTTGDVLVTLHKKNEQVKTSQVILSSFKTKTHFKQGPVKTAKRTLVDKENIAPWSGRDPWGGFNKFKEAEEGDQPMAPTSKWEKLQDEVQGTVATSVRDATEARFLKLETGMHELREQGQKFETWFHEAGQSNASLRQEVGVLTSQVKEHHQTIQSMNTDIRTGFANIEALLSKKQRQE